jgi:hypothetical protein
MLNTGCFEVTSNHVSKPVGPAKAVEFRYPEYDDDSSGWYVRHFHSEDFDFDIGLDNNTERLEVPFFFWILPVPEPAHGNNRAFRIFADFCPAAGKTLVIDPRFIEYIPTNAAPINPTKLWLDQGTASMKPILPGPILLTNHESFTLEYEAVCDPDTPFQLSVGGISTSGEPNSVTIINYKSSKIVRGRFKLPY